MTAQEYTLNLLEEEKAEHCLHFMCYLVKAYQILKPEMHTCVLIRAVNTALEHPSLTNLFQGLEMDKSRTLLCAFFQEDKATAFEDDVMAVTTAVSNVLVQEIHKLCIIPQTNYINCENELTAIKEAQALSTMAIKGQITETTAMAIDTIASMSPEQLEELISCKVKEKTKTLMEALKKASRGASSSALLKTQSQKSNTKNGNHSGRGNTKKKQNKKEQSKKPPLALKNSSKKSAKKKKDKEQAEENSNNSNDNNKKKLKALSKKKKVKFNKKSKKPNNKSNHK